ncbi:MAG: hypothetical protein ACN23H_01215 [Candidatus Phytoplasma vitis]
MKSTIYLSDGKTVNYINTFHPRKNKSIDDFKRNELLKNQTFLKKLKAIIELQEIVDPTPEEKTSLSKLKNETKKSFKLEKKEFIELIDALL